MGAARIAQASCLKDRRDRYGYWKNIRPLLSGLKNHKLVECFKVLKEKTGLCRFFLQPSN
jgi:hypothetical protein